MNTDAPHKIAQKDQILEHLLLHGSITPLEAFQKYGCFRLGARIWELKRDGHCIDVAMIEVEEGKRVAEYTMIHSDKNGQLSFL